jgi:hypothetical protein
LSKPRPRALLYGFVHIAFGRHYLEDYCAACRAAIAAAKRYWRTAYNGTVRATKAALLP